MDEIVLQGMARWPNVPSVYGWLSLDRRGTWRLKGEPITHAGLTEFIARNYERDGDGRWFFQNGPQRVYVRIEFLPMLVHAQLVGGELQLQTHTRRTIDRVDGAWLDEQGDLIIGFDGTGGLWRDRDLGLLPDVLVTRSGAAADDGTIERALARAGAGLDPEIMLRTGVGPVRVGSIRSDTLAQTFGFVADPRPAPGEPEC